MQPGCRLSAAHFGARGFAAAVATAQPGSPPCEIFNTRVRNLQWTPYPTCAGCFHARTQGDGRTVASRLQTQPALSLLREVQNAP
jgi:hypothetical protein